MESHLINDPAVAKLAPAALGSAVSLGFLKGLSTLEKVLMGVGGSAFSYYGTSWFAKAVNMSDAEGLVGFLLGVFGMTVVAKVYEGIQATDFKSLIPEVVATFFKRGK